MSYPVVFYQDYGFIPFLCGKLFKMKSSSLTKKERILKRADFINLNLHGKRYYTKNFIVIIKPNRGDITRLGLTVSKRVGNSVIRNRMKRLIREFFRLHKHAIPKGYDVMVVALRESHTLNVAKVQEELASLLIKNGNLFS